VLAQVSAEVEETFCSAFGRAETNGTCFTSTAGPAAGETCTTTCHKRAQWSATLECSNGQTVRFSFIGVV
jgi:hypothetical protein